MGNPSSPPTAVYPDDLSMTSDKIDMLLKSDNGCMFLFLFNQRSFSSYFIYSCCLHQTEFVYEYIPFSL